MFAPTGRFLVYITSGEDMLAGAAVDIDILWHAWYNRFSLNLKVSKWLF